MNFLNKQSIQILLFGIISILFLLLFSYTTSPLFHVVGMDSAIFKIIGNAILNGKIPYVDIFDHKGPVLFYIEALGLFINYNCGVFILQCISMTITLILWYKIANLFINNKLSFIVTILTLLAFARTIDFGNQCEEWSLPLVSLPLYLALKSYEKDKTISCVYTLCIGICFGMLTFIRINNGALICGIAMGYMIIYLLNKQYFKLLKLMGAFILGILIVAIPICLYFYSINALIDMINGTFTYNMKEYKSSTGIYNNLLQAAYIYGCCGLIIVITSKNIKQLYGKGLLLILIPIIIFVLLLSAYQDAFTHYYTMLLPVMLLCLIFTLKFKLPKVVVLIVLLPYIAMLPKKAGEIYNLWKEDSTRTEKIHSMLSLIPDNERSSVYNYNLLGEDLSCFIDGKIIPINKYFIEMHRINLGIQPNDEIDTMEPIWIFIHGEQEKSELPTNYTIIDSCKQGPIYLYKRTNK